MNPAQSTPIVDAHLDLAWNAHYNRRDLTQTVAEIRRLEGRSTEQAQTSLPDFARGNMAIVFATLYAMPANPGWGQDFVERLIEEKGMRLYRTPEEAEAQALEQLAVYQRWQDQGLVRILTTRQGLREHLQRWPSDHTLGLVLLMEGADPIVRVADLEAWWARGLRMVGLSWAGTRYAGGTGDPRGLSPEGLELVGAMRDLGLIHDASHLSEAAFWEALEVGHHALVATHSNPRALLTPVPEVRSSIPPDRHLSDAMIEAIGQAGGVIGLNLINEFLEPRWTGQHRSMRVTLGNQVRQHWAYVAERIGWDKVGIGSDTDAGMGKEETPEELDTVQDWVRLGEVVPPSARAGVLGGNWIRLLERALP
jgi:membrane dipeptidase